MSISSAVSEDWKSPDPRVRRKGDPDAQWGLMDPGTYVPVYFSATLEVCFLERKGYVSMCFIS